MPDTVAVLGAGNMGTALAQVISSNGSLVRLWSIERDVLEEIRDRRRNSKYLGGIELDDLVEAVWELPRALAGAQLVILSVPSQVVPEMARDLAPHLRDGQVVLNVAKGLEAKTGRRLSEVLAAELGDSFRKAIGSMGGPAIAIEMAREMPMAVIVGLEDEAARRRIQRLLQNEHLKVETTSDVAGLELCSTLKNVYAIALGMCDGLGFGMNTKAFIGTLAIEEMASICLALGGERETVYGLAGLGDLLTTGWSQHSRNRTLGEKLGSGADWQTFLREKTVEGAGACQTIKELTADAKGKLPLLEMIHAILFAEQPAPDALRSFLREFAYG
jgi:glycerol-3-phosphate dehydrogenase (NAD(P)+)